MKNRSSSLLIEVIQSEERNPKSSFNNRADAVGKGIQPDNKTTRQQTYIHLVKYVA